LQVSAETIWIFADSRIGATTLNFQVNKYRDRILTAVLYRRDELVKTFPDMSARFVARRDFFKTLPTSRNEICSEKASFRAGRGGTDPIPPQPDANQSSL